MMRAVGQTLERKRPSDVAPDHQRNQEREDERLETVHLSAHSVHRSASQLTLAH